MPFFLVIVIVIVNYPTLILLIAFGAGDTSLSYYLQHLLHVHCLLIRDIFRFYPRDAMRKRGLCCHPVSVCLSVRHVDVLYPDG